MTILETAVGEYVCHAVVPPFLKMPEVLTWGVRTFVHQGKNEAGTHVYREGMNFHVTQVEFVANG
jgi:hypothetical protein